MRRPEFIARQSRCPSGVLGRLIGYVMAVETVAANEAALDACGLEAGDRVLEVGFGHGRTIERAAAMVGGGLVVGIDASAEMVGMATRRCRRLIEEGRVRLVLGDSAHVVYPDEFFDKAYAIHTIYFWDDPAQHLHELHRVLREGGRLVLGFRPKEDPTTADYPASVYSFYATDQLRALLVQAGFDDVRLEALPGNLALAIGQRRERT